MNINFRQILIIVSVVILFELMAVALKKCDNAPQNIFPLPLNENTRGLLIGDWKYETASIYNDTKYIVLLARFKEDSVIVNWHYDNLSKTLNGQYVKWTIENRQIKFEKELWKAQAYFYNEDEFNAYDIESKKWEKWIRISETKHPYLYDNSK